MLKGDLSSEKISVFGYGVYGIAGSTVFEIFIPIFLSTLFVGKKKAKQRGVPVDLGGEAAYTVRNSAVTELTEVPWEGATTMAALFDQSCKKHSRNQFLGTRKLISKESIRRFKRG